MILVCELLHLGYGGFISFVDCLTAQAIDLLAKQRNIPNIMYTEQPCSFDKSTASFHLLSSCSELNTAIADIVMKLNYLEALVLYDKSLGMEYGIYLNNSGKMKCVNIYIYL